MGWKRSMRVLRSWQDLRREDKRSWGNLLNWLFNEEQYKLPSKDVEGVMRRESEKHGVFTEFELQEKKAPP